MKKLLFILAVFVSLDASAWQQRAPLAAQQCQAHQPWGVETTAKKLTAICRAAYAVAYDAANKIPDHVMWTLTPDHALGCVARTNAFVADQSVVGGATPNDYVGTGFDKGHMAPDGDLSWDQQVEYESFLMTNMNPQAGSLNRGIWKLLETSVRGWVVQQNTAYSVISGAIYSAQDRTIGNGVRVPHAYYKIVVNQKTGETAGWEFPHVAPYPNLGNDLTKFRKPIAQITADSGVTYKFPANAHEIAVGREWPVDFGALTNQKRKVCGASAQVD